MIRPCVHIPHFPVTKTVLAKLGISVLLDRRGGTGGTDRERRQGARASPLPRLSVLRPGASSRSSSMEEPELGRQFIREGY